MVEVQNEFRKRSNSPVMELPVLHVSGGQEDERLRCGQWLVDHFLSKGLAAILLPAGQVVPSNGLLALTRRYDVIIGIWQRFPWPNVIPLQLKIDESVLEDSEVGPCYVSCRAFPDPFQWDRIVDWSMQQLTALVCRTPVWACILIGGKSSRMGRPKHLLKRGYQKTWLEQMVERVAPYVDGIVLSGPGKVPAALHDTIRLPDVPGVGGPLAGIVAASRWLPSVSWLLLACDMPNIDEEAILWLLGDRRTGCWGRIPRHDGTGFYEPLFAWYDMRAAQLLEEQLCCGERQIGAIVSEKKVETPVIPARLVSSWDNVNTPQELRTLKVGKTGRG